MRPPLIKQQAGTLTVGITVGDSSSLGVYLSLVDMKASSQLVWKGCYLKIIPWVCKSGFHDQQQRVGWPCLLLLAWSRGPRCRGRAGGPQSGAQCPQCGLSRQGGAEPCACLPWLSGSGHGWKPRSPWLRGVFVLVDTMGRGRTPLQPEKLAVRVLGQQQSHRI